MATGGGDRFTDREYVNWLRATLSLMYMKEGLEEFTDNQSDIFHKQLFKSVGKASHACQGKCSSADIKKDFRNQRWYMTCSVCDLWLQNAISYHRNSPFPNLSPANTHPNLWQTESWEIMKLYMPFGCEVDTSAKDADIQGILSLFINCKHFSTGSHIGRKDLLDKLIGVRNSLLHSANFKVSEGDVKNYFQTVLAFMQGMTGLTGSEKDTLQAAIDKVQQLAANQIEISVNKDLEVRALQERQIALDRDLRALDDVIKKEQDNRSTEVKQLKDDLKELNTAKDKFNEFLELNDLVLDVSKLSTRMGDIDQTLVHHATRISTLEDQIQSNTSVHPASVTDLEEQSKELQQHLLHTYGRGKFWENPVTSEEVFLSQMYVQPSIKFIREIDDQGMLAEVEEQASSKLTYEGIFLSKSELCENIYITGDAGKGKTTFCNQLFLHWCNAVKNIQNKGVSPEDQAVLASFRFLFHINLRYAETTYHVEDMIQDQLLFNVRAPVNVSDILKTERCLIVMDGLDEWLCPDNVKKCPDINQHIPGRNTSNKNCVFLTTTRSWKYDAISLNNKDVEKHVELSGIGEDSAKELAKKILDNLDRKSKTRKPFLLFYDEVKQKGLSEFLTVPALLIQLLTLWHAGKDFGKSQLQLYSGMLDLMFECSAKNLPEKTSESSGTTVATPSTLPECFSTKYNCQTNSKLLHCLAKLAYQALFNKQKEEALVFKRSNMDIFGISPSDIQLCLQCGILSQCKDYANYTGKYKKFSFLHKKVQECLAAMFLLANDKDEHILKEVKQLCNSVETMLEMNQVWLFVAGMDRGMTKQLLEHFGHVDSADERVKTYRQTLYSDSDHAMTRQLLERLGHVVSADERANTYRQTVDRNYRSLIYDIQRCVSDCVSEGINNGHHYETVCLQDFSIYMSTVRDVELLLFCSDMSKVKSVYIWNNGIDAAKVTAITGQFLQCRSLQKLHLFDPTRFLSSQFEFFMDDSWPSSPIPDSTVAALVDNNSGSLTSLNLSQITAKKTLVTAICTSNCKSLMALTLGMVKLSHKHLEQILDSLSKSTVIRELVLKGFDCTDHRDRGCRAKIDCSVMTQLQKLTLSSRFGSSVYKINLPSLPHCFEKVDLECVTLPMTSLWDFARGLSQTKHKMTVRLSEVTLTETREESGIRVKFRRTLEGLREELKLMRECAELKGFLKSCPGLELTKFRHTSDRKYGWERNTLDICFHSSSQ